MIQLPTHLTPSDEVLEQLRAYQAEIVGDFATKQALVKRKTAPGFSSRNKPNNPTFKAIRALLTAMCSGPGHCAYCEAAPADEVEHFFPKDLFPDKCYKWENFLYACGQCNGPKSNKFALFVEDGTMVILSPEVEPPQGTSVLINPREENGMDFCRLNLKSFHFEIIAPEGTQEYQRADYTFNTILRLNTQRENLRKARRNAYQNYKGRLTRYHKLKERLTPAEQLANVITELQEEAHPTVWWEMQRSHKEGRLASLDLELDELFQACPEALTW
jgi:hypothetical protein